MAYSQYKNSGRSLGRILHQLDTINIPLRIVETVVLVNEGRLTYCGEDFATVEWSEDDVPYFTFFKKWELFNQNQDIYASRKNHYELNNVDQIQTPTEKTIKIASGDFEISIILNEKQIIIKRNDFDQGTLHRDFGSALVIVGEIIKSQQNELKNTN